MSKSFIMLVITEIALVCWFVVGLIDKIEAPPHDSTVEGAPRIVTEDDYPLSFAYTGMRFGHMGTLPSKPINEAFERLCLNHRATPGTLVGPALEKLEHHLKTVGPHCAGQSFEK